MDSMDYTDKELREYIEKAKADFNASLKEMRKSMDLKKAEESTPGQPPAEESSPPGDSGDAPPADKAPAGPPAEDGPPPSADDAAPADPAGAPGDDAAPTDDDAGDMDSKLASTYAAMDPETLMAHYKAAKEAVLALIEGDMGSASQPADASPAPSAPAPAAPPPAAPAGPLAPAAPPPEAPPMAKSEKEELEELRKSYGDLNETVEKLGKALHFLMSKPSQKAVVATDPKLAEKPVLTRDQVLAKLKIKAQDLDLKKSDRELITAFAVKEVSVEAVEHLLK